MMSRPSVCLAILLIFAFAGLALGQGSGGKRTSGTTAGPGFGSVLFPGTGSPPNSSLSSIGTLWSGMGSSGGRAPGTAQGRGYISGPGGTRGRTVVIPYAIPVYYGGGYGYYGGGYGSYPQQQEPNVMTIIQQPAAQYAAPTPVIINQYFSQDSGRTAVASDPASADGGSMKLYEAPSTLPMPAPRDDKPTIYLIAFKAGAIYPTLSYWVEDDTLYYVAMDKNVNKASLDLIDRELSTRLNDERHVEFKLK